MVVCTLRLISEPPSTRTTSKISPIAWNELERFGPPLPTNSRTVSPTWISGALSPVMAPTAPLKST